MHLNININSGNAAFAGTAIGDHTEVRRILTRVTDLVCAGRTSGIIRDINGNTCGSWVYTPSTPEE